MSQSKYSERIQKVSREVIILIVKYDLQFTNMHYLVEESIINLINFQA